MDARTYPNAAVQRWMKGVVAYRLNAEDAKRQAEVRQFGVRAYPTLVLLHPTGRTLFNESGGRAPDQLTLGLAYKQYSRMIELCNAERYADAAPLVEYLRRYFSGTKTVGKAADGYYKRLSSNKAFVAAYKAAVAAEDATLKKARDRAAAEGRKQRVAKAEALFKEADALRRRGKRQKAINKYMEVNREYEDTPSAKKARVRLRKYGKKIPEPEPEKSAKPKS